MPEDRAVSSLAGAGADRHSTDRRRNDRHSTNRELLRRFNISSASPADAPEAAAARAGPWHRTLSVVWLIIVAAAAAKVAVAGWSWAAVSTSARSSALLPMAVNLLMFGLAGALLIVGGRADRRVRYLGTLFLFIAAAFADVFMPGNATGVIGALVAELRRLPLDAFLPLSLWLFVRAFPTVPTLRTARRVADVFVVVSATVGGVLFAANVWVAHRVAASATGGTLLRVLDRSAPTLIYWPLLFVVAAVALPYLVWKLRFETVEAKQRGAVFILALVGGITPMLVAVIATPFVPALSDPSRHAVIGLVLYGALLSVIPSTAYAVIVTRIMDVHLILRKTSQHALARYTVWLASVGPLTYLFLDMYLRRGAAIDVRQQPTLLFVLPLVGFGVLTFRERLLRGVDGWFLRGSVDYAEAVACVEIRLREARSVREIAIALGREIERAMHPAGLAVCVVSEDRQQLVALEGTCRPLSTQSVLVALLRQVRCDIQVNPQADGPVARLLPPADREWLIEGQLTLLCPLIDSTDRLLGLVAIGESRGGLPYTKADRQFITTISGQAAVQLENRWLQEFAGEERGRPQPDGVVTIDWDNEAAAQCPNCSMIWPGHTRICFCHTPTVPAAVPVVVNGKFKVERLIGSGGMGVVYLAVDVTLDRKVAIKTLPRVTPDRVAWLQREARAMASVRHPNLALIYGAEHWRGTPLLIVEYLEGGTLSEYLRRGVLDVMEAIDLGIVLTDVLVRVHASGILHRDIKPSNIAYTSDGVAKLLDFGVAAIVDRTMSDEDAPAGEPRSMTDLIEHFDPMQSFASSTQRLVGTPLYLSPEAMAGQVPHASFDLWSVSLVLYEALAGHHPFDAETVAEVIAKIQATEVPDVRHFRPDCPAPVAAVLRDSLSPVLGRRPATATDLRLRLQHLRATLGSTTTS